MQEAWPLMALGLRIQQEYEPATKLAACLNLMTIRRMQWQFFNLLSNERVCLNFKV